MRRSNSNKTNGMWKNPCKLYGFLPCKTAHFATHALSFKIDLSNDVTTSHIAIENHVKNTTFYVYVYRFDPYLFRSVEHQKQRESN